MTTSELQEPPVSANDDAPGQAVPEDETDRRVMLHMPVDVRSASTAFLAVAAGIALLRWMDEFIVPVLLGAIVSYALTPIVDRLERWKLPRMLAAALVIAIMLGAMGGAAYALRGQADAFLSALPRIAAKVRHSVVGTGSDRHGAIARVEAAAAAVQAAATGTGAPPAPTGNERGRDKGNAASDDHKDAAGPADGDDGHALGDAEPSPDADADTTASSTDFKLRPAPTPRAVAPSTTARASALPEFSLRSYLLTGTLGVAAFAGQALVVLFVALFLLSAGSAFRRKIIGLAGTRLSQRRITLQALDEMHDQIQRYLIVQLVTSIVVGVATAIAFFAFGLDNAMVWGIVAAMANLVPYLGAVATSGLAAVAGLVQFGRIDTGLWLAASSFAIHLLVGNLLTPWLAGRASRMSPFVVFVGVLFFGWLWGVAGLVLAFPILVAVKITCERVEDLKPLGEMMST